jgi:hypothetical protein
MGFFLVPIGDREIVVGTMIGMAMFDCRLERLGERDRRIQMKPIYARTAARELRSFYRRSE